MGGGGGVFSDLLGRVHFAGFSYCLSFPHDTPASTG